MGLRRENERFPISEKQTDFGITQRCQGAENSKNSGIRKLIGEGR
jgi:hypothetical protein